MKKLLIVFSTSILSIAGFLASAQDTLLTERLRTHVEILASDSLEGRGFGTPSKELAIDYILSQYREIGLKPLVNGYQHTFTYSNGGFVVEGKNIIGYIEGSDPFLKNEFILLGAHYDHLGYRLEKTDEKIIYNGADDNASGVASLLEIARIMISNQTSLNRSLLFVAFDGEEVGLLGSEAFVEDNVIDITKIKAMFSLDMVGMYEKKGGLALKGIKSLKKGHELASQAAGEEDLILLGGERQMVMFTDTWPFALAGIPAIHAFTGTKSPYHKPEDDSHLLDYSGMAKITLFMANLLEKLADDESLKVDKGVIRHGTNPVFSLGAGANLGYSRLTFKDEFFESKPGFKAQAGLFAQWKLTGNLILQPGVFYDYFSAETGNGMLRMHAIAPELNLLLTTPNKKEDFFFGYLLAGGYYRYLFAANLKEEKINPGENIYQDEFGIQFGIGVQAMGIQVGLLKKIGLDDMNFPDFDGEIFTRGTCISLSYYF
ncbi:MAG: M20/M25/M40 family metallo-hydrolase [Bacteroidales bacterium]|nr:M20/M25/M40 family metallo-hydrolase [Bacteroidales bacterium]